MNNQIIPNVPKVWFIKPGLERFPAKMINTCPSLMNFKNVMDLLQVTNIVASINKLL